MVFTPVGDALQNKVNSHKSVKDQLEAARVLEAATQAFQEHFGEKDVADIKPLFLKNRTLTVTCASSVVSQEIRINQANIVKKINAILGNKEVDRIRYLS
ncbi:MAG: hypothetical protein CL685_02975 [Candidatus Magasanikbacteria bacterium]|nr:hypothetical protein [Candidatus Magasanikbacteria bacterium]|tara:strand:- start:3497 stop:3796 length:300 start_codon:yes stop_codon:yes gene_type:complete